MTLITESAIADKTKSAQPQAHSKSSKLAKKLAGVMVKGAWRNTLAVHPAADRIREATKEEKRSLAGDLMRRGQQVPVLLVRVAGARPQLLDGRTRLDLLEGLGIEVVNADGNVLVRHDTIDVADDAEAEAKSLSLNLHRRHLGADEKRKLIRDHLRATPEKSDRQIGAIVGMSHPTVAAERKKLEVQGDVEKFTTSTDALGRKQPRNRARNKSKIAPPATHDPHSTKESLAFGKKVDSERHETDLRRLKEAWESACPSARIEFARCCNDEVRAAEVGSHDHQTFVQHAGNPYVADLDVPARSSPSKGAIMTIPYPRDRAGVGATAILQIVNTVPAADLQEPIEAYLRDEFAELERQVAAERNSPDA